jgi:hypothetical protein
MMKESRFNPDDQGRMNDYGIFQVTPIYVAEANRLSEGNHTLEDVFSIEKSIRMFSIVQGRCNGEFVFYCSSYGREISSDEMDKMLGCFSSDLISEGFLEGDLN